MTKSCLIRPSLLDRNEIIRRFSTDRKLNGDIQPREIFAQTIAKSDKRFTATLCRPLLFPIRELIESSTRD